MPLLTAALAVLAASLPAAELAPGYVVKVETGIVYLDFTEKAGASVGQPFQVYTEGEELKHPITGQSLGRVESKVAEGKLTQVLPMYSIGELSPAKLEQLKPGMKARLGA